MTTAQTFDKDPSNDLVMSPPHYCHDNIASLTDIVNREAT